MNTNTVFHIKRFDVKGLWEEMHAQVLDIERWSNWSWVDGFVGVYYGGKITPLEPSFGGFGLMSALMHKGEFYCTSSWGSGIHRSRIVKLQVRNGSLNRCDSGGFEYVDVFVSEGADGKAHAFTGEWMYFNGWKAGKDIGVVAETNSSRLRIIGPGGDTVVPTWSYQEPKRQQNSETNGIPPIGSQTNREADGPK
jgi:hypothetical protein